MPKPENEYPIPEETAKLAKAAFPNGNTYLTLRDAMGTIFTDKAFRDLYPTHGQPAESPGRLPLITIMQYLEDLPDRQAEDAGRSRINW